MAQLIPEVLVQQIYLICNPNSWEGGGGLICKLPIDFWWGFFKEEGEWGGVSYINKD